MHGRIPTAADLWHHRDDSLRHVASRCGCSTHAAWNASQRAGFIRSQRGKVTHAPCASCGGEPLPRAELDDQQHCASCRGGADVSVVQREFRAYVQRMSRRGVKLRGGGVADGDARVGMPHVPRMVLP